jgi:predicted transcriptional regulator
VKIQLKHKAPKITKILKTLKESQASLTPKQIAKKTGIALGEVYVLLHYSKEKGWVESPERGVWKITSLGQNKILDLEAKLISNNSTRNSL